MARGTYNCVLGVRTVCWARQRDQCDNRIYSASESTIAARWCFITAAVAFALGCPGLKASTQTERRPRYSVLLVYLIIAPDRLKERSVSVSGFLKPMPNLYSFLTKEHAKLDDVASPIPVSVGNADQGMYSCQRIERLVTVHGTFGKNYTREFRISRLDQVFVASPDSQEQLLCWAPESF